MVIWQLKFDIPCAALPICKTPHQRPQLYIRNNRGFDSALDGQMVCEIPLDNCQHIASNSLLLYGLCLYWVMSKRFDV